MPSANNNSLKTIFSGFCFIGAGFTVVSLFLQFIKNDANFGLKNLRIIGNAPSVHVLPLHFEYQYRGKVLVAEEEVLNTLVEMQWFLTSILP